MIKTMLRHIPLAAILVLAAGCVAGADGAPGAGEGEELAETSGALCTNYFQINSPQTSRTWISTAGSTDSETSPYTYGFAGTPPSGPPFNFPGIPSCTSFALQATSANAQNIRYMYAKALPGSVTSSQCVATSVTADVYGSNNGTSWTQIGTTANRACNYIPSVGGAPAQCACIAVTTNVSSNLPSGTNYSYVQIQAKATTSGSIIPVEVGYRNN